MSEAHDCCPRFDPAPWQDRIVKWKNQRFVKDRVRSFLRIPLNFGGVMKRNMAAIEAAGAAETDMVVLSDENSMWGLDLYLQVTKDVPGVQMATISGLFLAQAYEGPYRDIPKWIADIKKRAVAKRKTKIHKLYFFYTTCPVCAKKYGKNYVVVFAQLSK